MANPKLLPERLKEVEAIVGKGLRSGLID